jgi:CubicO group peptidase (beta-lactamase class C family)
MLRVSRVAVFMVSLVALVGCASGLRQASSPESVGLSSERLKDISAAFQAGVDKKEIPGAVVLIARRGEIAYFEAFGYRDREMGAPMTRDAIFRVASMTKPIVSVAAMMLIEEGKLSLSDPVSRYIPEFKNVRVGIERKDATGKVDLALEAPRREMTVLDLLRHTSGLTYGIFGKPGVVKQQYNAAKLFDRDQSNAEFAAKIAKLPLLNHPGTTWDYSMSTDVLGRVVEVASGMELEQFLATRILVPLGMNDTAFWLSDTAKHGRIAEAQADAVTGKRPALPEPRTKAWQSGGIGLVSTAADYARFCQTLLNGGELDGVRIVSKRSIDSMTLDHLPKGIAINQLPDPAADVRPEVGNGFGLGFMVRVADGKSPLPGSVGDYGWGGAFGTYYWADPKRELFAIAMFQAPGPAGAAVREKYRAEMRKLVYGALVN